MCIRNVENLAPFSATRRCHHHQAAKHIRMAVPRQAAGWGVVAVSLFKTRLNIVYQLATTRSPEQPAGPSFPSHNVKRLRLACCGCLVLSERLNICRLPRIIASQPHGTQTVAPTIYFRSHNLCTSYIRRCQNQRHTPSKLCSADSTLIGERRAEVWPGVQQTTRSCHLASSTFTPANHDSQENISEFMETFVEAAVSSVPGALAGHYVCGYHIIYSWECSRHLISLFPITNIEM